MRTFVPIAIEVRVKMCVFYDIFVQQGILALVFYDTFVQQATQCCPVKICVFYDTFVHQGIPALVFYDTFVQQATQCCPRQHMFCIAMLAEDGQIINDRKAMLPLTGGMKSNGCMPASSSQSAASIQHPAHLPLDTQHTKKTSSLILVGRRPATKDIKKTMPQVTKSRHGQFHVWQMGILSQRRRARMEHEEDKVAAQRKSETASSGSDASLPKTLYVIPPLCTMTQWPSEP